MFLGYNTNGMAHHDLFEAVGLLAEIGYRGVAITIDHGPLWPPDKESGRKIVRLKKMLRDLGLRSAIETGARFLLDPRLKHEPTLVSADPRRRIEFYKYAVDLAAELGSDCVSLWSGAVRDGISPDEALKRLAQGLHEVLDYAAGQGVVIAMEPEPGMLIDSTKHFEDFLNHIDMRQPAVDARHRSFALSRRSAYRRDNPPLGRSIGKRARRGHESRRSRTFNVRRRRDRFSPGY